MPTPIRPQSDELLYHVTVRGVERRPIVRDDADRERWVAELERSVDRCAATVHAWCLMTNHAHLVVDTPRANLAAFMGRLNGVYAASFNRRHRRAGHLYDRRYATIVVEREPHFVAVVRYVVLNPVRAGICARAEDWRWSSHRATAGLVPPPRWLETRAVLDLFGRDRRAAATTYAEFVAEGSPAATLDGLLAAA